MANHRKPYKEKANQVSASLYGWQIATLKAKYGQNVSSAIREAVTLFLKDDEAAKRRRLKELQAEMAAIEAELRAIGEIKEAEAKQYRGMLEAAEPARRSAEYQNLVKKAVGAIKYLYGDAETGESKKYKLEEAECIGRNLGVPMEIVRDDIEAGLKKVE
ncbi:MAG TPA: hypothetical protein VMC84_01520 [Methanocella sp.]|uniref:hypothetical protein n=1 Tax=Methanocella sp. TaxID=2052833 RepID=UPI002C9F5BB0|nr:hypothetical protein [Methanocella sp.]HTY89832.1 hypothetical protein [Methanocella sp.]